MELNYDRALVLSTLRGNKSLWYQEIGSNYMIANRLYPD
jgi:hypothetical protein